MYVYWINVKNNNNKRVAAFHQTFKSIQVHELYEKKNKNYRPKTKATLSTTKMYKKDLYCILSLEELLQNKAE
jgi:hypothetical protein